MPGAVSGSGLTRGARRHYPSHRLLGLVLLATSGRRARGATGSPGLGQDQPRLRRLRFGLSAGSAGTGPAAAGSAATGSAVAGSAVAGSAGAGSAGAGSAGAGSAVAGSAVAGSAGAGSATEACWAPVYWTSTASDAAAARDGNAVLARPRPDRRGMRTSCRSGTTPATSGAGGSCACPACCGDESSQAVPQAFGVLGGKVDLIRPAIDSETNCLSCLRAVDVVDELDGGSACQRGASGSRRCRVRNAGGLLERNRGRRCLGGSTRRVQQRHPPVESFSRCLWSASAGCACCSLSCAGQR